MLLLLAGGCSDNAAGPQEPAVVTNTEAAETITQVMQERGLITAAPGAKAARPDNTATASAAGAPALTIDDYMTVDVDDAGERRVHFDIGPDGHIIPSGAWRDANPNYCKEKNRFMKGAVKRLQFKMFKAADGYLVYIQYIDVATGVTENQQEGEAATLKAAVDEAWDKFQVEIKPATGPCGRPKGLTLVLDSRVREEKGAVYATERVEASISLTPTAGGGYEGSGALTWTEASFGDATETIQCTVPDGSLTVTTLSLPEAGEAPGDIVLDYRIEVALGSCGPITPYPTIWKPIWIVLHQDEVIDGTLRITAWDTDTGDEAVLARKVYDRSQSYSTDDGGTVTVTEATTVELRNEE